MVEDDVRSLVVQDEHGHLQGVITRVQILDAHLAHDDWGSRLVKDHMVRDVPVVAPQALLADAARALLKSPLHEVVVVLDDGGERRPVAMLTDADLAYHLVREG
jgi:CBS domain-containing protein